MSAGRQGLTWFGEDQTDERAMLARWTVAFSFATMAHLRKESDLERSLQARLGPQKQIQRGHEMPVGHKQGCHIGLVSALRCDSFASTAVF